MNSSVTCYGSTVEALRLAAGLLLSTGGSEYVLLKGTTQ